MVLPSGWKEVKLGECFDIQLGKMLNEAARKQEPQFPYIANVNVRWGALDLSTLSSMFFSEREKEKFALKKNDILMCEGGEIGRCVVLKENVQNIYYQKACHRLRAKNDLCDPWYLYFYMSYIVKSSKIIGLVGESSIAHLPVEKVEKILLTLPPLAEQKKIAETLSVWDSAIEKMEKLIDEKENLFKVELKAKIIVRGFEENWEKFTVKDCVVALTPPSRISQDNYKKTGNFPVIDQSKEPIAGWTNDENCIIRSSNPLIIFGDHTCILKIMKIPFAQGADGIKVLSANDRFDAPFLYYSLKADPVVPEGYKRHYSSLQRKEVFCPSKDIQKKLARYFEIKDKELSLLKQQLALYKKQKQGLMQKLLTGEWRVK